jgi:hypothetical protein
MAKKRNFKYQTGSALCITWEDPTGENQGWYFNNTFDFEEHLKVRINKVVGFLVNIQEGNIFLSQLWRIYDGAYARVISIPESSILEIYELEKKDV